MCKPDPESDEQEVMTVKMGRCYRSPGWGHTLVFIYFNYDKMYVT